MLGPRQRAIAAGLLLLAAAFLMIGSRIAASAKPKCSPGQPVVDGKCQQTASYGNDDSNAPVLGQVGSWQDLVKAGDKAGQWYWDCLRTVNGTTRDQALDGADKEKHGWNLQITLVENMPFDPNVADQALANQGLSRDPDVVPVGTFTNTRHLGSQGCNTFSDSRKQVRLALTLPGTDKDHPGAPVVLEHCSNPIAFPVAAPPPAPHTVPKVPVTPSVPRRTPVCHTCAPPPVCNTCVPPPVCNNCVPPPVCTTCTPPPPPPKCPSSGTCGTPTSGPEQNPRSDPGRTPGYTSGSAESNQASQPTSSGNYSPTPNGTDSGCSNCAPSGQTSGPSGNESGTGQGTSNSSGTEGSGQTSSGDPGAP
ncbi:MAG TPA: hypothetical protein VLG27_01070 [Candidatus Saccharimonadia bacterium]|nr:hypothetical protein [Candidatus Saccharimonadia bacterium]